jgi:hypothetical protein
MGVVIRRWPVALAWSVLAVLLMVGLPLFVCMPVWVDASLYDLAARNVLRGGVHYRDVFDTNLPGMVWLHVAVRSAFGWRVETLRLADIALFTTSVWLLAHWLKPLRPASAVPVWLAVACFAFYFSTSEWCHCQRDVWMLPPALAALYLRRRQLADLVGHEAPLRRLALRGVLEGLCWGVAFWIKPFVAVPALACWILSAARAHKGHGPAGRRLALDAGSLLAGGMLAGGAGVAWLVRSGAWPYFCNVFLDWNWEYARATNPLLFRVMLLFVELSPWGWIHVAALPAALWLVYRGLRRPGDAQSDQQVLLAGFYLGWLVQAVCIQKAYDYSLAPLVPLALTLIAGTVWPHTVPLLRWCMLAVFTALTLFGHPVVQPKGLVVWRRHPLLQLNRLAVWGRCWREGSSPEVRDRLKLLPLERYSVAWVELGRVQEFLEKEHVQNGEVTCYHTATHPLYLQMDLEPTTPYLHFDMLLENFPNHRPAIRQALIDSRQKYVVSDLQAVRLGLTPAQVIAERPGEPCSLPPDFPAEWLDVFPWSEPVVFRAGRYLVHRMTGPVKKLMPADPGGSNNRANPKSEIPNPKSEIPIPWIGVRTSDLGFGHP